MTLPPFADAIRIAAEAFDRLGIPYLVGGSVATVVHGEPRNTHDADIVIDVAFTRIDALAAALQQQFFADAESMRLCSRLGIACNVVHRTTGLKLDLFWLRNRPFSRSNGATSRAC